MEQHRMGMRAFCAAHDLDVQRIVKTLNERPLLKRISGVWFAFIGGEAFTAGTVADSGEDIVRRCVEFRREQLIREFTRETVLRKSSCVGAPLNGGRKVSA
jgi:hypothetical protein